MERLLHQLQTLKQRWRETHCIPCDQLPELSWKRRIKLTSTAMSKSTERTVGPVKHTQ